MSDSVYRVTEVIGVSADSWEAAAQNAVQTAARTIRDLRAIIARAHAAGARLDLSFKYESGDYEGLAFVPSPFGVVPFPFGADRRR